MQLVHRGWNPHNNPRHTLHGALWTADTPVMMHEQGQELHIDAVLSVLGQGIKAAEAERLQSAEPAATKLVGECLRGYLRECPADATEAGSLLTLLRSHQRRESATSAPSVEAATPRL